MRKLTIKRERSFVGRLGKYTVLVEDNEAGTITIGEFKYREICRIKNGEEKSFEIENTACKIAVIAGKLSKDYCSDVYPLEEGDEDVYLSGAAEYDPIKGNPFRFKNNNSEFAIANRNRGTKKGIIALVIALAIGCVIGFSISVIPSLIDLFESVDQPKDFKADGLTITLTSDFYESDEYKDVESYEETFLFRTDYTLCFIDNVPYGDDDEFKEISLMDYTEFLSSYAPVDEWPEIKAGDGFLYYDFVYADEKTEDKYYSLVATYKCDTSFYIVTFETMNDNKESFFDKFIECLESVTIE